MCTVDVPVYRPPVYRFAMFTGVFFSCHPGLPVVCRYTGVVNFFMLAEPLLLLHTPTHAAVHNTTQHAGCCGQQLTLAYTPCHVRQENYANLVTALPPQNSPAAAHAEVACTAFAVILMTTRKSTVSSMYSSIVHSCTNNTVVAGYHDSRRNTDTPSLLVRVRAFSPVYRFALFTGSFWSCHYRPVNRDIDCTQNSTSRSTRKTDGSILLAIKIKTMNNGIWSFLDYVEDIAAGRPLRLSANLDSNLLPFLLHILYSSCFYILML